MASFYIVPPWFFGYDVVLELLFGVITLIVGLYAWKVYKLSSQDQPKYFSLAFILISISYFVKSVLNFMVIKQLNGPASVLLRLNDVTLFNTLGMLFHIIFFISGLVTLVYMTLKIKSFRTYSLLIIILCLSLIFNHHRGSVFYLLTSVLLLYLIGFYVYNYIKSKQHRTLIILAAFCFLLVGHGIFILSETAPLSYAIGHFAELGAYLLILLNLILIVRKVKK